MQKTNSTLGILGLIIGSLGLLFGVTLVIAVVAEVFTLALFSVFGYVLFGSYAVFFGSIALAVAVESLGGAIVIFSIGLLLPLLCVMGSIGLLKGTPWGRTVMIVYSMIKIIGDSLALLIAFVTVSVGVQMYASSQIAMSHATGMAITTLIVLLSLIFPLFAVTILLGARGRSGRPSRKSPQQGITPGFRPGPSAETVPVAGQLSSAPTKSKQINAVTQQLAPAGLAQRSATLTVISGRDLHREYTLVLKDFQGSSVRNVIGRSAECQVIISGDLSVGARHCEIREEDGHICLFNLAPKNSTMICRGH